MESPSIVSRSPFELPLRAEIFSPDQLERHARVLAEGHRTSPTGGGHRLLGRLNENEKILRDYNRTTHEANRQRRVTLAAEWLLDNFYLIEEQIQMARRHLPRGYSRELPRLLDGPSAGLPRVYDIVLELIAHLDAQVDEESLELFVAAYQTVTPLRLGELWAVPIMLRLALIENLRRVTGQLTRDREDRNLADHWVKRLEEMAEKNPHHVVVVVADMAQSNLPLSSSFVAEFYKNLFRQTAAMHLARNWLEQLLAQHGLSFEQLVHQDRQAQAADQITISHTITSLRTLSAIDWQDFVENVSLVERTLREDPAAVYARMDFATRDLYRHRIEETARASGRSEIALAQQVVQLAEIGRRDLGMSDRAAHVGYYLIGRGQSQLERALQLRWSPSAVLERAVTRFPAAFYLGGILLLTGLGTLALDHAWREAGLSVARRAWLAPLVVLALSQLAVALVNRIASLVTRARLLPRLDFSEGIPADCRTVVAVPTLLSGLAAVEHLLEIIEIHYLANRDRNLFFALLTDFPDADTEHVEGDEMLLDRLSAGITALNARYAADHPNAFFLLHRPRRWNPVERRWMGHERKRGKLAEFNALLRGGARGAFSRIVGDESVLPGVRYVITLDTDTRLPREAARQLTAALAHPLNQPRFDDATRIVREGYAILQPRVGVSLPGAGQSWFVRLFAGEVGIDPYTRVVSDVYQDVFEEGSFIGKGIYDVDAFDHAIGGRLPDNAVLSHDLIESCFARSALISDVELYEEHPSRYNTEAQRRHRWIRGDWQIASWLWPRLPVGVDGREANPLSLLARWKIFDNLRRSLVPPALLLLLLAGWAWLPGGGATGTLLVLAVVLLPAVLGLTGDLLRRREDFPLAAHLRGVLPAIGRQAGQVFLNLVFLPFEAALSLDAIIRTLVRVHFTRRRLLEWQTASDAERAAAMGLTDFYRTMAVAPALALAAGVALARWHPESLPFAAVFLVLWIVAPAIAWKISCPIPTVPPDLSDQQKMFLRREARRIWRFFEVFVSPDDNWLPPDNFQEIPAPVIASRTSPTNIGLALLANLMAYDFGYVSVGRLMKRTESTFATLLRLERHRGHFYNWYDTRTLKPLRPLYVSSVDSGNLAGHLLTLGPGLADLADQSILPPRLFAGLADTLSVLLELLGPHAAVAPLEHALRHPPVTLRAAVGLLRHTADRVADAMAAAGANVHEEALVWGTTLERDCRDHHDDLVFLAPWLEWEAWTPPGSLGEKFAQLDRGPTLREISGLGQSLCPPLHERINGGGDSATPWQEDPAVASAWLRSLQEASERASQRIQALEQLGARAREFAAMDFTFLYDPKRELFSIGYDVLEHRRDGSYYDLLASEARLCSYVAVAQGQVTQDHWFSLSRLLVGPPDNPVLVSWSGSMFEYLMPLLVMPTFEHTLLDGTYRGAVRQQIDYGRLRRVPWGISESGYNLTDVHSNYQYRAFGVPGLGLKRGLSSDLVVAPYATFMALMVDPRAACENLERLRDEGRTGAYGFYEAIDYTPSRLPPGQASVVIRSFMAHHQGMALLALGYLLCDAPMQRRFMAHPPFRATDLLLHERVPSVSTQVLSEDLELDQSRRLAEEGQPQTDMRVYSVPGQATPQVHLLSNGRYHVVVSSSGGGFSRWNDLALTRWREDSTRDHWGLFIYLRDVETGEFWSTAFQPTLRVAKGHEAIFTQARVEFRQQDPRLGLHTEICVSPEDDAELRRVTLTNHTNAPRRIELTTYAEVVLNRPAADAAHPAFGNLFVQTEFVPTHDAVLCTRRASTAEEKLPWLVQMLAGQGMEQGEVTCETDRGRFLGRGRTPASPAALQRVEPLSNTTGSVLDPIIALRRTLTLAPGATARADLVMGLAPTREAALALAEKFRTPRMVDRAFDLAWTHSQVSLRHLSASEADAQVFGRLAGALLYADPARRAAGSVLLANRRGQSSLWSHGISGDSPIVLLRVTDPARLEIVRQLVHAHSYWRLKGLAVELVVLNEDAGGYRADLNEQIMNVVASGLGAQMVDKAGGIFVRRAEQISAEDRILLQAAARVVLADEDGTLAEQCDRPGAPEVPVPLLAPVRTPERFAPVEPPARALRFENGLGGFAPDGREYVVTLPPDRMTPAPWVNVLANPSFGAVITESGSGYTWADNCHEYRLTPWSNDPVSDPAGEAFYVRDEQTGQFWSPTPLPARDAGTYVVRHGFGYTVFEHTGNGIATELWIYVASDAPVKFAALKVRNVSDRPRRLSATGYWEWVLGELRPKSLLHVQTEVDPKSGALLARNPYNTEFGGCIAFIDVNDPRRTVTGDRREFIGRNGTLAQPAALKRLRLSGRVGAGLDPCGAVQVAFELRPGQEREVLFRVGLGRNAGDVQGLLQRFRRAGAGAGALEGVRKYWERALGAVQVETPDPAFNLMANGWLLYQTLTCRMWARTGFYQSGGAYGFRDQLQDSMALVHAEASLTREQIVRAAARQFREGDVQHWWHPPSGRGVRTHFSDDYLWLPYVLCRYVHCLADTGVLDESVPFLEGRPVKPDEESYYDLPNRSPETATIYDHAVRAIEHGLRYGAHGLPLIGCGDWNDGMNRVGEHGRGESVWLAFFLHDVLTQFAPIARARHDQGFADRCLAEAAKLRAAVEREAWDGEWYRRAYFDNGEPLGSRANEECRIDSLPQSWSVISGAGDPARARQGMEAAWRQLVRVEQGFVQLFDPPFDKSALSPGYIKGYIPGVRENGGQYTHAAIWLTMGFALLGDRDRAWQLAAMLNPVGHGATPEAIARYRVEPYVVAADIYSLPPHTGRGGWTWYTGSAGWMYRLYVETIVGVNLEGERLALTPRWPESWTTCTVRYRYRRTSHRITLTQLPRNSAEPMRLKLDGVAQPDAGFPLQDTGGERVVEFRFKPQDIGPRREPQAVGEGQRAEH